MPRLPAEVAWLNALRSPVVMDSSRARAELGWLPAYDALETLRQTIVGARESGLL